MYPQSHLAPSHRESYLPASLFCSLPCLHVQMGKDVNKHIASLGMSDVPSACEAGEWETGSDLTLSCCVRYTVCAYSIFRGFLHFTLLSAAPLL